MTGDCFVGTKRLLAMTRQRIDCLVAAGRNTLRPYEKTAPQQMLGEMTSPLQKTWAQTQLRPNKNAGGA